MEAEGRSSMGTHAGHSTSTATASNSPSPASQPLPRQPSRVLRLLSSSGRQGKLRPHTAPGSRAEQPGPWTARTWLDDVRVSDFMGAMCDV